MRRLWPCALAVFGVAALLLFGCGTPMKTCSYTLTVTPVTAMLNHSSSTGNSQTYTLNVNVPPGCPLPPLHAPTWSVSNTTAATITQSGVASCKAAASSPIVVSPGFANATATLICQ